MMVRSQLRFVNQVNQMETVSPIDTQPSESEIESSHAVDHTPHKWKSLSKIMAQCNICIIEPKNYEEATLDESWKKAIEYELEMIKKKSTGKLLDRPFDKPIIVVNWVYKTKLNLDGLGKRTRLDWLQRAIPKSQG